MSFWVQPSLLLLVVVGQQLILSVMAVYPLMFCNGLNASQTHIRKLELIHHKFPDSLPETDCVTINPCTQQNHRGEHVPAKTWLWRNMSGLWLEGNDTAFMKDLENAETQAPKVYNLHALEYARIPEGIHVKACEPDFSVYRRTGELVCNPKTLVDLDRHRGVSACPSTQASFSLLDCMSSVEKTPVIEFIPFRSKSVQMAFGSQTWINACKGPLSANLTTEAQHLCTVLETTYELRVERSSATSRTQMIWYDFSDGFGCYDGSDISVSSHHSTHLSRTEPPNTVLKCPDTPNGVHASSPDNTKCAFACEPGYTHDGVACVLGCTSVGGASLTLPVCQHGEYSTATCDVGGVSYFQCAPCPEVKGSRVLSWISSTPSLCQYQVCPAGTYGSDNTCLPCAKHTFTPSQNMSYCLQCNANTTGYYQDAIGQSGCVQCFSQALSEPEPECDPGKARVRNWTVIKDYFHRTGLHQHEDLNTFCSDGYACLPCEPGSFLSETLPQGSPCVTCAVGSYQPHFQSSRCHICSHGQSTGRLGATSSDECVCQNGFM